MSDLISREDAIDAVHYYIESGYKCDIFQELKDLPSVEPKRTSKALFSFLNSYHFCDKCGFVVCPNCDVYCAGCGAKLDWGNEDILMEFENEGK